MWAYASHQAAEQNSISGRWYSHVTINDGSTDQIVVMKFQAEPTSAQIESAADAYCDAVNGGA